MSRDPKPGGQLQSLGLISIGLTLALSVGIGGALGYFLDKWFKTNWLVILFTLLGVAAGFRQLIQAVIRANAEEEERDAENRRSGPR